MKALLIKDNNIDTTHIGYGFFVMMCGFIIMLTGKMMEVIVIQNIGGFVVVYGFAMYIILELLIGETDKVTHGFGDNK